MNMTSNVSDLVADVRFSLDTGAIEMSDQGMLYETSTIMQILDRLDHGISILAALTPAEQCFSVKEGYEVKARGYAETVYGNGPHKTVPLSEALTIRSAEEVRREGYQQGYNDGFKKSGWTELERQSASPTPSTDTTPSVAEAARVDQAIVELEAVKDYAEQPLYNHLEVGFRHNPLTNAETLDRYKYACEVLAIGINAALRALAAQTGGES